MDGGRVLRAILNAFLPFLTATTIAVRFGQLLALTMSVFFLYAGWWIAACIGPVSPPT